MEISQEQQQKLALLALQYQLEMILLFGSAASGRQHPHSDMDIAVLRNGPELGYKEYSELGHDLHDIFPGQEIDLSLINHADPLFLKKIMENCQILHGDIRKLQSLKLYAFKRYQDHKQYFEMERVYADRFLKEITTKND
jgi:predicted nucleotidyltransferase